MTATEATAIQVDAQQRLAELRAVRAALLPDKDDAAVISELTAIESEIAAAEQALNREDNR